MAIRILIVDDDRPFLDDIAGKLSNDYSVMVSDNANSAREKIKNERFDVVILDMSFRESVDSTVNSDPSGGIKLLNIMENKLAARTIFLSAFLDPAVIQQAINAGCRYLMFKLVKDESEDAFYTALCAYINQIGRGRRILYRTIITFTTSGIIVAGIVMGLVGFHGLAGFILSTTGVVLNLVSYYPRALR